MNKDTTPSAEETLEKVRKYAMNADYEGAPRYEICADLRLVLGRYEQLQKENKIMKTALEGISSKECKHAYPSDAMADVCEACKAKQALSTISPSSND